VVLAQITLPAKRTSWIGGKTDGGKISYEGRRVLYSTRTLQELCDCIPHPASEVSIFVQPKTVTLTIGETQPFTAKVTGSTNTGVDWSVEEGPEGGSITNTGIYTAPKAEGTYHVIAVSKADPTKSDMAKATVLAEPVSIVIQPKTVNLDVISLPLPTQQFTATVTGSNNKAVTWRVQEEEAGGAITPTGLYTPPLQKVGEYHVVATSQADPSKSDSATVTTFMIG
jgi:hypothetical protein